MNLFAWIASCVSARTPETPHTDHDGGNYSSERAQKLGKVIRNMGEKGRHTGAKGAPHATPEPSATPNEERRADGPAAFSHSGFKVADVGVSGFKV